MKEKKEKLVAKGDRIFTEDEFHIGTIWLTKKHKDLIEGKGRDYTESWEHYRDRIEPAREAEERKRLQLTADLVNAYNEKFAEG